MNNTTPQTIPMLTPSVNGLIFISQSFIPFRLPLMVIVLDSYLAARNSALAVNP
jgi:hypothetical protein